MSLSRNKLLPNYGWVQNTSNLSTVRDTLELVSEYGIRHLDLMNKIKEHRISKGNFRKKWSWDARCRIKAIHACGLIEIDRNIQGYILTDLGYQLKRCSKSDKMFNGFRVLTDDEIEVFRQGILTNPPVIRVLQLLLENLRGNNSGLTKYDIGAQLGFVGDPGFTHYEPEWIVSQGYKFNNKEGDADKWARTILRWIEQVDWLETENDYKNIMGTRLKIYRAKPCIENVLRYDARRVKRKVPSEFLCSDHHAFPKLIQKRRSILLEALNRNPSTPSQLVTLLSEQGIEANKNTIEFEVINLQQAGFKIVSDGMYYKLDETIELDINPGLFESTGEEASDIEKYIEEMVVKYQFTIPSRLVDNLIRYGFASDNGRLFESTVEGYFRFLGYDTTYLGQGRGRVSDIIARYIDNVYAKSYGIIIDAKATETTYRFPANDIRKMQEYIDKHGRELLEEHIQRHAFAFVSSKFKGNAKEHLEEIYTTTGIRGTAIRVIELLELGDSVKEGKSKISEIYDNYITNDIFRTA